MWQKEELLLVKTQKMYAKNSNSGNCTEKLYKIFQQENMMWKLGNRNHTIALQFTKFSK